MTGLIALCGPALAEFALEVRSDQPELSVGRDRYHLLTRLGPARLRLRGPGTLAVKVRVNLPPGGEAPPGPVVLLLTRFEGDAEEEVARWAVSESLDEGRGYAETERYRPSQEAPLFAELPPGEVVLSLTLASEAPLGAVFAARFFPAPPATEPDAAEPGAEAGAQEPVPEGPRPAPPPRPGLVPRLGLAVPLVSSGGLVPVAGVSLRLPLGATWRLDVSADVLTHSMDGTAPAGAGVGPPSETSLVYDALPLRLGAQWQWPLAGAQPFGGVGVGVTLGREHLSALRGAVEDEQAFLLLAAEARAGIEWSPAPGLGPLVVAAFALLHPIQVAGATYGRPLPVSFVALEVGYHVGF